MNEKQYTDRKFREPPGEVREDFVRHVLWCFNDDFHNAADPDDLLWRFSESGEIRFFVKCCDLFWWATIDCEPLTPENIHVLEKAIRDCNAIKDSLGAYYAPTLFCCRMRKMRPQGACYDEDSKAFWHLFDEAGPERETGYGNPKPRPEK